MPDLPEGTDRSRLVVVRPKTVPEGTKAEDAEIVVGAAFVEAFPDDVEFLRFDGETADAAPAASVPDAPAEKSRRNEF